MRENFLALQHPHELEALLGFEYEAYIEHLIYKTPMERNYRVFTIAKKNGGTRRISAPKRQLKSLQRKLAEVLEAVYQPPASIHAFTRSRSIVSNASKHVNRNYVINIDLENFFGSINFGRVRGMFMAHPYYLPANVSSVLAQICCFKGELAQGAPTSPIISNMICSKLDSQLKKLAIQAGCFYTRYADDISFSSSTKRMLRVLLSSIEQDGQSDIVLSSDLTSIIRANGFNVNNAKSRLLRKSDRQEVTGLVVNSTINVKRSFIHEVRGMLDIWKRHGAFQAQLNYQRRIGIEGDEVKKNAPSFEDIIHGKLSFIKSIRGETDTVYRRLALKYNDLSETRQVPAEEPDGNKWLSKYRRSVLVLESSYRDKNDRAICHTEQGTGFFLSGIGFVTSFHTVRDESAVHFCNGRTISMNAILIAHDKDTDIAIFSVDVIGQHQEMICETLLPVDAIGTDVILLGFPGYAPGNDLSHREGKIVELRNSSGVKLVGIDCDIIGGNSGGPVINSHGRVIGVARSGYGRAVNGETQQHNLFVPISAVCDLHRAYINCGNVNPNLNTLAKDIEFYKE